MFELCLQKTFLASHALVGGDWGKENKSHSHGYKLEFILESKQLGAHGYVADLLVVEKHLTSVLNKFQDKFLNDLEKFQNINPSLENFCRILWDELFRRLGFTGVTGGKVILWENENAWASYRSNL